MKQRRDEGKAPDPLSLAQSASAATPRKPYSAPSLVEYGTIAKLTQGSLTVNNDGSNTKKKMMCL